MDLTLEQCLQYLLYRDQKLTLPGIGVLRVKRIPAHFSDTRDTLFPPSFTLQFDENFQEAQTLIPNKFEQAYTQSAHAIRSQIIEKGSSDLFGIGRLRHDGEMVVFEENRKLVDKIWGGLEAITPISEVKRTFTQATDTIHAVETQTFQQRKPKNYSWLKWLLFLLLAGILIYFVLFFPWESDSPEVANAAPDTTEIIAEPTPTEPITAVDTPLLETSSDTLNKERQNTEIQPIEYVIITGSFKSNKYIDRMSARLNKLGYEIYKGDNDSTTRVGIRVKCTEAELSAILSKVRKDIEPKAWVLK